MTGGGSGTRFATADNVDARQSLKALQSRMAEARTALASGDRDCALKAIDAALAIDPGFLVAQALKAQLVHSHDSRPTDKAAPQSVSVREPTFDAAAFAGRYARVEERAKQRRLVGLTAAAQAAIRGLRFDEATAALEEIRRLDPARAELKSLANELLTALQSRAARPARERRAGALRFVYWASAASIIGGVVAGTAGMRVESLLTAELPAALVPGTFSVPIERPAPTPAPPPQLAIAIGPEQETSSFSGVPSPIQPPSSASVPGTPTDNRDSSQRALVSSGPGPGAAGARLPDRGDLPRTVDSPPREVAVAPPARPAPARLGLRRRQPRLRHRRQQRRPSTRHRHLQHHRLARHRAGGQLATLACRAGRDFAAAVGSAGGCFDGAFGHAAGRGLDSVACDAGRLDLAADSGIRRAGCHRNECVD